MADLAEKREELFELFLESEYPDFSRKKRILSILMKRDKPVKATALNVDDRGLLYSLEQLKKIIKVIRVKLHRHFERTAHYTASLYQLQINEEKLLGVDAYHLKLVIVNTFDLFMKSTHPINPHL